MFPKLVISVTKISISKTKPNVNLHILMYLFRLSFSEISFYNNMMLT